jgi:hypothetical protein
MPASGPKTVEGKRVVSRNAVKHGFRAATSIFTEEERARINEMVDAFARDFDPQTPQEHATCAQMGEAYWQMQRIFRMEEEIACDLDVSSVIRRLYTLSRYNAHYERIFHNGLKQLESKLRRRQTAIPVAPCCTNKLEQQRTRCHHRHFARTNSRPRCKRSPARQGSVPRPGEWNQAASAVKKSDPTEGPKPEKWTGIHLRPG